MGAVYIMASGNNHYVEYITKGPGILFDPVGILKVINDQFHIVIPVDISHFKSHVENIHNVFNIIRLQCRESGEIDDNLCFNQLQPLESLYNDILRDFESISQTISNSKSKRSAWFSGIGVVFKHIFGTLDEDDANEYNNAIRKLSSNDKVLTDSMKKSIIVSQSAIYNFNQSLYEININQAKLSDIIDRITLSLNNMSSIVLTDSFKIRFDATLNVLQSYLFTLSFKMEDILNSLLFVKSNTIHPSILTPHQLYKDIVNNLKIIPKYRDFPVTLELNNIHILMNVAELVCYYLDGKLMFVIKIPLVSALEYNLYKNIPLPIPHVTGNPKPFIMILPSGDYLALSTDKTSYTLLQSLNSCKIIPNRTYLCEITDIYTISGNPSCETEIITKALTSLPEYCPYRFLYGNIDIWHRLNDDKWIFVQSKPTKITIECQNNEPSEIIISGTGVLNIPLECVAYHRNTRLLRKMLTSIRIPTVSSDFNIINDSCCNINRFKQLNIPITKIKNVNLNNLKNLKIVSDQIITDLKGIDTANDVINNHISFPILSVLAIILCFSFIIIYICKKGKFKPKFCVKSASTEDQNDSGIEMKPGQPRLRIE